LLREFDQRGRTVGGLDHTVARALQRVADDLSDVSVVVGYKDRGHAAISCERRGSRADDTVALS
jgi:hypothetical protein